MAQTGPQSPAEEQAQRSATEKDSDFSRLRNLPLPLREQFEALGLNRALFLLNESELEFRERFKRTASYAFCAGLGRGLFQRCLGFQRGCLQVFALPLSMECNSR
jgi:hypothetical protein